MIDIIQQMERGELVNLLITFIALKGVGFAGGAVYGIYRSSITHSRVRATLQVIFGSATAIGAFGSDVALLQYQYVTIAPIPWYVPAQFVDRLIVAGCVTILTVVVWRVVFIPFCEWFANPNLKP